MSRKPQSRLRPPAPSPDPQIMLATWVDPALSAELPVLRAKGESQTLEYMESFPQNTQELAREIAAFATSNSGTILIGVANDGTLRGLGELRDIEARDHLMRRIEGICTGTVKPSVTPGIAWACEDDRVVLALTIPKGAEPVYYSGDKPYLRHLSQSRPAAPHEVLSLIRHSLGVPEDLPASPLTALAGTVAAAVCDIAESAATYPQRAVAPHVERLRAQVGYAGERLISAAATDEANERGWVPDLLSLADITRPIGDFIPRIGPEARQEFVALLDAASAAATLLYQKRVIRVEASHQTQQAAQRSLRQHSRELRHIAGMLDPDRFPRNLDEIQTQVSLIGFYIAHLTWWGLHEAPRPWLDQLQSLARETSLIETMRSSIDGGQSQRRMIQAIKSVAAKLDEVIASS